MKDFTAEGIPHFILVGLDGKIINPNGHTPSENLKEVLASLSNLKSHL